jgi:short-subunit dehydrogenase
VSQTVLITGASSGIGQGLARAWLKRGARVWGVARRQTELEALARESSGLFTPVVFDVSDDRALAKKLLELDDVAGGFEVAVANAGIGGATPVSAPWDEVSQILRVNVMGAAATLHTLAGRMVQRGRGRLCGIASLAAYRGFWAHGPYNGSKAFISMYLEALRIELHGTGVTATCVYPGIVKTAINAKLKKPPSFSMEVPEAAEVIVNAVERGERRVAFPKVHAMSMRMTQLLPDLVWEPIASRTTRGT